MVQSAKWMLTLIVCFLVVPLFAATQIVKGKTLKIIQDDWNNRPNGFIQPVYARIHNLPNSTKETYEEYNLEPSHMLVVRGHNRTLYVELEPVTDLLESLSEPTNLSHASGVFKNSPTCLFRGKVLNHGGGIAALSICQGQRTMVQLIYMYDSMQTSIKIVIVKLQILKPNDNAPDKKKGDIDKYLDTFCAWQAGKVTPNGRPGHWDHAILLTGKDLYKVQDGQKSDKVLGLAWVNGMCRPTYSCTINEGRNFEAAYVIAHELAHSLGVLHDGSGNNCHSDKYIMSDKTGPGKTSWSECTNQYMQRYFNRGHARCLDDNAEPPNVQLRLGREIRPPGMKYGPEEQCHLAMGLNYKPYISTQEPFENICRELWCYTGSWATPAHPALDGTSCSPGRRCNQGLCEQEPQSDGNDLNASSDNSVSNYTAMDYSTPDSENDNGAQPTPDGNRNKKRPGFFSNFSSFFRDIVKRMQGFFLKSLVSIVIQHTSRGRCA